ncbi:MAG: hypothetical protein AMXMBFR64_37550 [Myxococcales bacterium]
MTSEETKPAGPSEGTSQGEKASAKPKKAPRQATKSAKGATAEAMIAAPAEDAGVEQAPAGDKPAKSSRGRRKKQETPDAAVSEAAASAAAPEPSTDAAAAAEGAAPAKKSKSRSARRRDTELAVEAQSTTPAEPAAEATAEPTLAAATHLEAGAAALEAAPTARGGRGARKGKAPAEEAVQLPLDGVALAEDAIDDGSGDEDEDEGEDSDGAATAEAGAAVDGKKKRRRRRRKKKPATATEAGQGAEPGLTAPAPAATAPAPEGDAPAVAARETETAPAPTSPPPKARKEPAAQARAPKQEPEPPRVGGGSVPLHRAGDDIELPKPGEVIDLRGARKGTPVLPPKKLTLRKDAGDENPVEVPKPGDVLDLRPGRKTVAVTEAERAAEDERVAQLKERLTGSPDAPSSGDAEPERGSRDERGPRRERDERGDRGGRRDREERGERGERSDRGERGERGDRRDRGERRERDTRDRGEERAPRREQAAEAALEVDPAVIEQALRQGETERGRHRGARRDEARTAPTPAHAIDITVAIMARRRGPSTKRLAETIVRQDLPWEGELLIVDCGSGDGSIRSISPDNARVVSLDASIADGAARDQAVQAARGAIVVFIGQDAAPDSSRWLVNLTEALFEDERVGLVTGPVLAPDAAAPGERGRTYHRHDTSPDRFEVEGGNLAVRRSVAQRIPFASYEGELQSWVEAVLDAGATKRYEPSVTLRRAPERVRPEPQPRPEAAPHRVPQPEPAAPSWREAELAPAALSEPPHLWEVPLQIATQTLHAWSDVASGREPRSLSSLVLAPLKATRKVLSAYNRRSLVPIPKFLRED